MEHDLVVAPVVELEPLEFRAYALSVIVLVYDGEEQDKNGKL